MNLHEAEDQLAAALARYKYPEEQLVAALEKYRAVERRDEEKLKADEERKAAEIQEVMAKKQAAIHRRAAERGAWLAEHRHLAESAPQPRRELRLLPKPRRGERPFTAYPVALGYPAPGAYMPPRHDLTIREAVIEWYINGRMWA